MEHLEPWEPGGPEEEPEVLDKYGFPVPEDTEPEAEVASTIKKLDGVLDAEGHPVYEIKEE